MWLRLPTLDGLCDHFVGKIVNSSETLGHMWACVPSCPTLNRDHMKKKLNFECEDEWKCMFLIGKWFEKKEQILLPQKHDVMKEQLVKRE